jgi:hypothetical protein
VIEGGTENGKLKMKKKKKLTSHFDASFSAIMLKLKQFLPIAKRSPST